MIRIRKNRKKISENFTFFIVIVYLIFIYWCVNFAPCNSISARVDDFEIVVNCGESIKIKDGTNNYVVEIEKCHQNLVLPDSRDIISIAGIFTSFYYKELGMDYLTDWDGKIVIIDVWREGAKTAEGVKIGDSFSVLESIYGKDFKCIVSARSPNNKTVAYPKLGVLFFGTINPDKINVISVSRLARYVRYIRPEKEKE